jgi:hypothetical protein
VYLKGSLKMKALRHVRGLVEVSWLAALVGTALVSGCVGDDTNGPTQTPSDGSAIGTTDGPKEGAAGSSNQGTGGSMGTGGEGTGGSIGTGGTAGAPGIGGAQRDSSAGGSGGIGGSGDGGVSDADAAPSVTLDGFQHAISVAWCDRVAECCGLDDAQFDRDKCISSQDNGSGPERISIYTVLYKLADAGFPATLSFDPVQAARCISLQRGRSCTSEDETEKRNLYGTCLTAVQGNVLQGGACTTSLECRGGFYCPTVAAGGTATCTPLSAEGAPCDDPNQNGDRCTYLGLYGDGSLYCAAATETSPRACSMGRMQGIACNLDQQCAAPLICSSVSRSCATSQPYPGTTTCVFYTKPDAGTD